MVESHGNPHKLTKFFLAVSIFAISTSVLAIYGTIMASENSSKKSDLQAISISHLTKSQDWWNDYQAHKLREKLYQIQIDNLNNTLQQQTYKLNNHDKIMYKNTLLKYQLSLDKLHASKTSQDSLANLSAYATNEENLYYNSLKEFSNSSNIIETYDMLTILLIIGSGLTGLSEITKNKLLAYAGFVSGGLGVIILIVITLIPI